MQLALFDLDHTILDIDSDYSWGEYIVQKGMVDEAYYRDRNARFYTDYIAGTLDPIVYNEFVFETYVKTDISRLKVIRESFMAEVVIPAIRPKAVKQLQQHVVDGHTVVIITATNSFITRPIADYLGVQHLIATEPEIEGARFTGKVTGQPCFQKYKLVKLQMWLGEQPNPHVSHSWGYSDSFNDIPLLEFVDQPAAVNPDNRLQAHAVTHGWPVLDWSIVR